MSAKRQKTTNDEPIVEKSSTENTWVKSLKSNIQEFHELQIMNDDGEMDASAAKQTAFYKWAAKERSMQKNLINMWIPWPNMSLVPIPKKAFTEHYCVGYTYVCRLKETLDTLNKL